LRGAGLVVGHAWTLLSGRRLEQRAFGMTGDAVEKQPRELRTAGLAPDKGLPM